MRQEKTCRRPGFRPGRSIRLADGQFWTFPAPVEGGRTDDPGPVPAYRALLRACLEAEDEPEQRRAELALGIALLDCNYVLDSSDFSSLLEFPAGDPNAFSVQEGLACVAVEHLRAFRHRKASFSGEPGRASHGWGLLVRPWRWFGVHSHLAHASVAPRPHPSSTCGPLTQESSLRF